MATCKWCGKEVSKEDYNCKHCGKKLKEFSGAVNIKELMIKGLFTVISSVLIVIISYIILSILL